MLKTVLFEEEDFASVDSSLCCLWSVAAKRTRKWPSMLAEMCKQPATKGDRGGKLGCKLAQMESRSPVLPLCVQMTARIGFVRLHLECSVEVSHRAAASRKLQIQEKPAATGFQAHQSCVLANHSEP